MEHANSIDAESRGTNWTDLEFRPPGRSRLRWLVRFAFLGAAIVLLVPPWAWDWPAATVPSLSVFAGIVSTIAARSLSLSALIVLPVLLVVLIRRRWFCHHACPTGLLAELVGRLRGRGGTRGTRLPPIGQWLALSTVGGACLGYPLFLWLDPLAIFAGFVNAWGRGAGAAAWLCAAGLPLILLISLVRPGLWCTRLCPLGATQDLLARPMLRVFGRQQGTTDLRVGPDGSGDVSGRALAPGGPRQVRSGGQDGSGDPSYVGWVSDPTLLDEPRRQDGSGDPSYRRRGWLLPRRVVVAAGLGALGATTMVRWVLGSRPKPLRPPGAVGEDQFTGLCERCGNCARVCPSRILHPDLGQFGADSFLTPVLRYDGEYCLETCQRCTHVCPSGALRPLSTEEKPRAVIGLPRVDMSVCLLSEPRECAICGHACPYEAIRFVWSDADYVSVPQVDPHRCNGCGACQVKCPTTPVKAIVVQQREGMDWERSGNA